MNDPEFIAEIVVRKVGDKYAAQWSGEVELSGHGQSAPEALVDLAEFLMDPPDSRLSVEQKKIEGSAWGAIERAKCKLGADTAEMVNRERLDPEI